VRSEGSGAGALTDDVVDLSQLDGEKNIFSGSARNAALKFPENSNVAAIVALAACSVVKCLVNRQLTVVY